MAVHTITVPDDSDGIRLDRFLVSLMPEQSRSQIQRLIKEGHVRVAGREAKANQAVKGGQDVVVDSPALVEATPRPEALPLPILYQDKDLIVIDKPAGMVVHPAAGIRAGRWSTRCCTTSTTSAASAARSARASSTGSIAARRG